MVVVIRRNGAFAQPMPAMPAIPEIPTLERENDGGGVASVCMYSFARRAVDRGARFSVIVMSTMRRGLRRRRK